MKQFNESQSPTTLMAIMNIALKNPNLELTDLIAIHSELGLLKLNNPKLKSALEAKLKQVEIRMMKMKGIYSSKESSLAEQLLNLINS